jgi:hypothetical protein
MKYITPLIIALLSLLTTACVDDPEGFTGDEAAVDQNAPAVFIEHEQMDGPSVDDGGSTDESGSTDEGHGAGEFPPGPDGAVAVQQACDKPGPDSPTLCGDGGEKGHGSPQPLVPTDEEASERDEE